MVSAAMNVFLSFIAALATSDSRSALMCINCIHIQQNTLITTTWGKRSRNKIHTFMSTRKQTWPSKTWGKNAYNEMLFLSFKISFPWLCIYIYIFLNNHFWSLEWIWQCSGTTVITAKLLSFFKCYLYLLHSLLTL